MKWSWKVFTAFGIGVYVHATFLLLILWVFLSSSQRGVAEGLLSTFVVLFLFACVVLHEFGHALTARRFGIRTRDITLLPIGGVARLERIPTDPRQEFLIAVAGPAVNVVIAGVLLPLALLFGWGPGSEFLPGSVELLGGRVLAQLILLNLWMAAFNFIPAFPMDGGRVLRALLAMKLDYVKATRIAVATGQALAFGFGLLGFLQGSFVLILIAIFIYVGAAQEGFIVQYRYSFQGYPASVAMITSFRTLRPEDRLEKAVEYLLVGSQVDFPVVQDDHQVLGILTRAALIDSLGKKGPQASIQEAPIRPVRALEHDMPLDRAFDRLQEEGVPCLPVMRNGELVGILTTDNIAEFAMITSALRSKTAGASKGGPSSRTGQAT